MCNMKNNSSNTEKIRRIVEQSTEFFQEITDQKSFDDCENHYTENFAMVDAVIALILVDTEIATFYSGRLKKLLRKVFGNQELLYAELMEVFGEQKIVFTDHGDISIRLLALGKYLKLWELLAGEQCFLSGADLRNTANAGLLYTSGFHSE